MKKVLIFASFALAACTATIDAPAIEAGVTRVMNVQSQAWNAGDIDAYMAHYQNSSDLRFAGGGVVERGWQETLSRYKMNYPDKAAMGTLIFSNLEVEALSPSDALVFGRWQLERTNDTPNGLFTLHFKKINGKWVIVSDHTSSAG